MLTVRKICILKHVPVVYDALQVRGTTMLWKSPQFWTGIIITLAIGVSSGALVLTNAIPADWIKPVTAWCGIIAFIGSAIQTGTIGLSSTVAGRLSGAAQVMGVKGIQVTPDLTQAAAAAVGDNAKVITTAK